MECDSLMRGSTQIATLHPCPFISGIPGKFLLVQALLSMAQLPAHDNSSFIKHGLWYTVLQCSPAGWSDRLGFNARLPHQSRLNDCNATSCDERSSPLTLLFAIANLVGERTVARLIRTLKDDIGACTGHRHVR